MASRRRGWSEGPWIVVFLRTMCDGFNHAALQLAVAQICQSMGWDGLQKSSHDLLTDVLRHYLEEIAKSAHGYCQQYSRTEPNLDDLGLAFEDVGVLLHELEDFVSQVDQVPFIHQLPRYPKPKASVLHHPRNGEIVDRLEHYYDHLPPLLVNNLLQHEDEEKTAGETPDNPVDAGNEQEEGADGFIRKEIKTVGEETCNETVAVKRPRESPPAFEKEAKKQRLESPFLQKGNKGNEMDILHALQGNLSSPSPTPSPDAWSTEKAFEIPPIILAPTVLAHSLEKAKATSGAESRSSITGEKKQSGSNKGDRKSPTSKQKPSPKKKAKPARNTPSPARKSATPVKTTPPKLLKEKSPSPLKSPLASNKSSPKVKEPGTPNANEKKTPSKKGEKPAAKMTKVKKPPPIKSPTANPGSEIAKENIASKESMPKLIIKPIKQEVCKEPEFAMSELLPVNSSDTKEKSPQPKRTKSKQSLAEKPKPKKSKEGPVEVAVKIEPKETSIVSGNVGLKFSIADFAATTQKSPPLDKNVPGNSVTDAASEHKKKKKKHKEKDKDKEKKKDKSKKLKADLVESSQASSYSTPAIPRIKLKLDPSSYRSVAEEPAGKPNAPRRKCGTVPGEWAGSASPSNPQAEKLQPTFSATSPAGSELENVPVAKAVVKAEPPERTVTSQTVSTTFVHGYTKEYYCPVCGDPDDGTFMIGCDGCDEWFHGRCVGIEDDPGNADWFCSSCLAKKDKDSKDKLKKKKKKKSKGKEK